MNYFVNNRSSLLISVFIVMCSVLNLSGQTVAEPEEQKNFYIKSIFFGGGSYYIDDGQAQDLVDFVLSIEDLREYEIEVHGHTDNIGSLSFNQWLSEMRSGEVLSILSSLHLDRMGIQVHDFGEESPYYDNRTWDGKLSNRRVDVIIQKIAM